MTRLAVGFTQQMQLEWLEWTAAMTLAGMTPEAIHAELQSRLRPLVSVGGDDRGSNRAKVIAILLKTWVNPPAALRPFHEDALRLCATTLPAQRVALHWGMALAVYPFLGVVAGAIGRLLELQGRATYAQVRQRVRERYGERESIDRATRRVLYSLWQWQVIGRVAQPGVYVGAPPVAITQPGLSGWLVEAALLTRQVSSVPLGVAARQSVLFPFALGPLDIAAAPRLHVLRQGLDNDVVMRVAPRGPAL